MWINRPLARNFWLWIAAGCLLLACSKAEESGSARTLEARAPAEKSARPLAQKTPGVSATEIVLGATTPLTGPGAGWGVPISGGMQAWIDHINERGGIHGRELKLIVKDDAYNPARALANLQEMKDEVLAVVGQLGSAPCAAAKDFFPENRIPLIHAYANVEIYANQPKEKQRYYFSIYPDYQDEAVFWTTYAVNELGAKKIAHFYQNDDYGMGANAGVKKALESVSGKATLVAEVPYEATERAVSTHALKLKESGADTLMVTALMSTAALINKELDKIAYRPRLIASFPLSDTAMFKIAGASWEGTYVGLSGQMGSPGADPAADRVAAILVAKNEKLKGREILALFGAGTIMHLAEGLKNAGKDLTRESLIKGMEMIRQFRPEGMGAPVTYAPNRHHGINAILPCQAKGGINRPLGDYVVFDPKF
ncbi:MAG: ABC transporter substrate-binding protein [Deltaproteobacteria bacterium]|nr:ABC transporter substrate-binding protein [Deltaproteobacteria bacterium]